MGLSAPPTKMELALYTETGLFAPGTVMGLPAPQTVMGPSAAQ
jgi:hypothetical protein